MSATPARVVSSGAQFVAYNREQRNQRDRSPNASRALTPRVVGNGTPRGHRSSTQPTFETGNAPLFEEYLSLLGSPQPEITTPIGPNDCLIVIDMQCDFVPKHPVTNPDGGRFAALEGEQTIEPIVNLIDHFARRGGHVVATRDYHPWDHCCFFTHGGPYPPHCVQGTTGSYFVPEICEALKAAIKLAGEDHVSIVFKGFHEDVDSFAAFPYAQGGYHVAPRLAGPEGMTEQGLPEDRCVGCEAAPWTGAIHLKQSGVSGPSSGLADFGEIDPNAPPDILALLADGHNRPIKSMNELLQSKGCERIFVCGLCLDVCVLDTCVNAVHYGFAGNTYQIMDACRAPHIHGFGVFGSGFLYGDSRQWESNPRWRDSAPDTGAHLQPIGVASVP